ncbi:MBL fold metallo-hydrolase [Clostridium manihotivorum]|uniref:MBL fold metallo-hydrolase n=1 Tax=Clostridium manihotivorum TaxID=2320868 RepID=A0A410DVQ3_9CLOT|nr:MBL fold metallo-hydrolase [Clostridium manihotivorum]QAA33353.1 MBL fold metallo-hydrolase [Clostridium manihotivorum]
MQIEDNWFTIEKIDDSTFAISEYGHWEKVHSFLLLGHTSAVLIDTGLGIDNIKRITDRLTKLPIKVLTTHVHWDHIGNHHMFEEIFVHSADSDWLENGIKGISIDQIRKDIIRDTTKDIPGNFDASKYIPYTGKPKGLLEDGDIIDLGKRTLKIYHTPGHSPGHICIHDMLNGYLFTGDLLYSDDTPIYAFYPSTDPAKLVNSLERLLTIPNVTKVFGSHNKLSLSNDILKEVSIAITELRSKNLIRFGTGIHQFKGFKIQF